MLDGSWGLRKSRKIRINRLVETPILTMWLYPCHTNSMKTAISLPDRLYDEAEKTAQSLGIPRSQLFAKALEEFIEHHKRENITERLNKVYARVDQNEFEGVSNLGLESIRNLTKNDSW